MNETTTYYIEIPPVFWADHADRCVERQVPIAKVRKGRIAIELTGDEIADLHSDAIHYSNPNDFDFDGAFGLSMSARATRKAIEAQVANLDTLVEAYRARIKAERLAFEASPKYAAIQAEAEAARKAAAARLWADPRISDLRGRRVRHEQTAGHWVDVDDIGYSSSGHTIYSHGRYAFFVESRRYETRCSEVGIEVEV